MMLFSLYVQQNQWIVNTLLGGLGLTILFCLTYWSMWRPREEERSRGSRIEITGPGSFLRWIMSFTPWVLVLIVVCTAIYTITHLYMAAGTLPNW